MNDIKYYEDLQQRIRGPVFSLVTPFRKEDDAIDFEVLERYIQRVYDSGGRIFYVMGYNSRFSELSWDEIRQLNGFAVQKVKALDTDNIVIVADPLHCPTTVSIEFAQHAEEAGADLISLIFREKFYFDDQVFHHYHQIASATRIGLLIHEMPFIHGLGGKTINWPLELLDRLADVPSIVAIKEDAHEDAYSKPVIAAIKDRVSIVISGGGKRQWLRFADLGCQSWLNGIGVFEPRLAIQFWEQWKNGEMDRCLAILDDIETPFFEKGVQKYGWHLTIKAALESLGIMSRHERMPMMALREPEYKKIKLLMQSLPIAKYIGAE